MASSARSILAAAICVLAAATSLGVQAQVYRIVGPDGKVTFSDRPPETAGGKTGLAGADVAAASAGAAASGSALPFELRSTASRYPVTLYTGSECAPCGSARNFLTSRGIPFTERTVSTNEDAAALRRLSGEVRVPFLTIGSQQLHGYSETEWSSYLDAAGYPRSSQLPAGYRNPPPAPLVAAQASQPQARADQAAPPQSQLLPTPDPVAPKPSNPAGIRF